MLTLLKKQAGTSLLNLITTIAIIGTTTAISAGQVDEVLAYARNARRQLDMHQLEIALELYYTDHNGYPIAKSSEPTEGGWEKLAVLSEDNTEGPYISKVDFDPLNEDGYVYKYKSDGQNYEIWYFTEDDENSEKQIIKSL